MQVQFYKALWGMEEPTTEAMLDRIQAAGYQGFEAPVPMDGSDEYRRLGEARGLGYIAMIFPTSVEDFSKGIDAALRLEPELINVHAGKDWWTFQEGCLFFEEALQIAEATSVPVCFETHRGRLLSNPWSAAAYLKRFPQLRITADFSHWTCVCESLLTDQQEAVDLAIERTGHLHARLGHENAPQVTDPRAPEWESQQAAYDRWWDAIKVAHEARGESVMRVDPEFGPRNYMPMHPFTAAPTADLWEICLYMRDRLKERWQ